MSYLIVQSSMPNFKCISIIVFVEMLTIFRIFFFNLDKNHCFLVYFIRLWSDLNVVFERNVNQAFYKHLQPEALLLNIFWFSKQFIEI